MYLSGGNATAKISLSLAENDVIWSACLKSPTYTGRNLAEWVEISHYINMRETLVRKSIYDHLTRMVTVDDIINVNASKAPWEAKN